MAWWRLVDGPSRSTRCSRWNWSSITRCKWITSAPPDALHLNAELEYQRNRERYVFLRWGQTAFENFRVVPPETGIVHQVNIEYLARVVYRDTANGGSVAYPDTVFGTDSHTTMVNGLGVVGWGVGGIEAEAAMLGQPSSMLIPPVVGVRLSGKLPEGTTATDLVLTITELLRKHGVVGKFVEFYGSGLAHLTIADRATLGNMCPEYGATVAIFPIDAMTLDYLRLTGRDDAHVTLVEEYAKAQGLFRTEQAPDPVYSETLTLDLSTVVPSLAGPRRPQDRVPLGKAKSIVRLRAARAQEGREDGGRPPAAVATATTLEHGSVVIAAITSCTNTSNPSVMIGAGLLAKKAVERGLQTQAVGQDEPRPGFEGRDRLPRQGRPAALSRSTRLLARRLRLYDLHRQQRPAARGNRRRRARTGAGGRLGAERQPQFRGPHSAGRARELPRVAAAGRRLCAGRHHEPRSDDASRLAKAATARMCS